jgi:CheY-like chemotaxis protein/anti-sigma regulatory factor (Ser/Thr protein kinase)
MLSALMDVGRLDGSTEPPTLVAVSVAELQSEVLLHFEEAARLKGLELEVQPVDLHVLSDRHLLRRILFNLVANAVKYTEFGCVAVTATARGEEVVIRVDDNGPGIPKAKLEDAFVEYVRLDPSHSSDGLGIGLATVRRAAALLSHPLKIVSSPGLGTMVTLRLPLHQPAQNGIESRTNQGSVDADGLVVGLIEDDVLVRAAMEELLVRWGCRPVAAASAEELLNALPLIQASVDLLIADYHLQGSNGLQAIQDVRAALGTETLPAILITGDVDDSISTEAGRKLVRLEHKPLLPARQAALVRQYGVAA